jgi:hypothetical protein
VVSPFFKLTTDIRHDIIADDQGGRYEKPNQTFEDVIDDEMARDDNDEQRHMNPAEKRELLTKVLLLEVGNERDEA